MKTSLDLPDDLYRRIKSKSALEGRAVREVATALFTAWVEGRVVADNCEASATLNKNAAPNPAQQWLEQWRELAATVARSTGGSGELVDELHRNRR